jgi:hypothetical protein
MWVGAMGDLARSLTSGEISMSTAVTADVAPAVKAKQMRRFSFRVQEEVIAFAEALSDEDAPEIWLENDLWCDAYFPAGNSVNEIINYLAWWGAMSMISQEWIAPSGELDMTRKAVATGKRDPTTLERLAQLERQNVARVKAVKAFFSPEYLPRYFVEDLTDNDTPN